MIIAGNIIIGVGMFFVVAGMFGYVKFKHFYERVLITAKIDSIGAITILIGVIVRHGFSFFSLKVGLLIGIIVIINPLATHIMAKCAHLSGLRIKKKDEKDGEQI